MENKIVRVPREGQAAVFMLPNGFGWEEDKLAAPRNYSRMSDEMMSFAIERGVMVLGLIGEIYSMTQRGFDIKPEKEWCLNDVEEARQQLLGAARAAHSAIAEKQRVAKITTLNRSMPHQGAEEKLSFVEIARTLTDESEKALTKAFFALDRYSIKCQQTFCIMQASWAMEEEVKRLRAKVLEFDPMANFPDKDEYPPEFFVERTGMNLQMVRHHLRKLQGRHGSKRYSKCGGRWLIFEREKAKSFETHLRNVGRKKKPKTSLKALN